MTLSKFIFELKLVFPSILATTLPLLGKFTGIGAANVLPLSDVNSPVMCRDALDSII